MHIDISKYETNKVFCVDYYQTKGRDNPSYAIAMISTITFVPVLAVAYWVGEASNWEPRVVAHIQKIKEFYGYRDEDIEGKPEGSPV